MQSPVNRTYREVISRWQRLNVQSLKCTQSNHVHLKTQNEDFHRQTKLSWGNTSTAKSRPKVGFLTPFNMMCVRKPTKYVKHITPVMMKFKKLLISSAASQSLSSS